MTVDVGGVVVGVVVAAPAVLVCVFPVVVVVSPVVVGGCSVVVVVAVVVHGSALSLRRDVCVLFVVSTVGPDVPPLVLGRARVCLICS